MNGIGYGFICIGLDDVIIILCFIKFVILGIFVNIFENELYSDLVVFNWFGVSLFVNFMFFVVLVWVIGGIRIEFCCLLLFRLLKFMSEIVYVDKIL